MGLALSILMTVLFLTIAYILVGKDICSPSIVIISIFLISLVFNIINYKSWNVSIGSEYVLIIMIGYTMTILGDIAGKYTSMRIAIFRCKNKNNDHEVKLQISKLIVVIILLIVFSILYYNEMMRIAVEYGNLSLQSPLQAIRNAIYSVGGTNDLEHGTSFFINQGTLLVKALAYVFTYVFLYNTVYIKSNNKKSNFIYLIPPLIYLIQSTLSTSRSQILYYFCGSFFMYYLLAFCRIGKISQKKKRTFIKYAIIILILFFGLFYLLGFLTRKSERIGFFDNISVYVGGSQVSFNNWLEQGWDTNNYWGEETFVGIRKVLHRLQMTDNFKVRHLEFINFGDYRGNVYTAYRRYLSDFGYIGLLVLQWLSTFLCSYIYHRIKREKTPSIKIVIYGYIVYTIAMEAIDELFFSALLEVGNVYVFIYVAVAYYFLFIKKGKRSKWRKNL